MTRKTGKVALKARQQMRAAKVALSKRELAEAGVSLSVPRPSAKSVKEKEEELRKLYLELFAGKEGEAPEAKPPEPPEHPEEKPPEPQEQPQHPKEKKPEERAQSSQS
jgi:ADP-heptose:LPS heptosyltransferase